MKKLLLFFTLALPILLISCDGKEKEKGAEETPETTIEGNETNQARQEAPHLKKITRYKTSPEDREGTILSEEVYDANGWKVEYIGYDYYGSGEREDRTTYKSNNQGLITVADDGNTITTYEYDDAGNQLRSGWTRANGEGASEENIRDEKGNVIETKYYNSKGEYDFSRTTEFEYDGAGKITKEIRWEKYTDGGEDLQMYYITGMERGPAIKKESSSFRWSDL